jgi:CHAD domain-containing protein
MRVALRRLRALLGLMGRVMPKSVFAAINGELKWLAGALEAARDWYVFAHETLPPIAEAAGAQSLAILSQRAGAALDEGVHEAVTAVQSERYNSLMFQLGEFTATRAWRAALPESALEALAEPVGSFAARLLSRRHRQLLKLGAGLGQAQPEARHAVRIAAKKLRYGLEFFMSVLPEKRARPVQSALAELQDLLGHLNDAAVAETLTARLRTDQDSSEVQLDVGMLQGWLLAQRVHDLAALDEAWARFAKLRSPVK